MPADLDLDECRKRALLWIEPSPGDIVTRATAINEEHLALDVVALVVEVERLRAENAKLRESADPVEPLTKECGHPGATIRNCPYASEINDNDSQRCSCCDNCAHECAMDV